MTATNTEDVDKARAGIIGAVDVIGERRVMGWVVDLSDPSAPIHVDILRDDARIARVRANKRREDLAKQGIGTGDHGFVVDLDEPIEPGLEFTIRAVARTAKGRIELPRYDDASRAADPQTRIIARLYGNAVAVRREVVKLSRHVERIDATLSAEPDKETSEAVLRQLHRVNAHLERMHERSESSAARPRSSTSAIVCLLLMNFVLATALVYLVVGSGR